MHLERTSLFTVQYFFFFFFGPKGEECISGLSFVSNAYCRLTALPEQLSWPFMSEGSPVHLQHLPSHLQILLPWMESFGERPFPDYQFPSTKFPFVWTKPLGSGFTGHISILWLRSGDFPASIHQLNEFCYFFQVGRNVNRFRKGEKTSPSQEQEGTNKQNHPWGLTVWDWVLLCKAHPQQEGSAFAWGAHSTQGTSAAGAEGCQAETESGGCQPQSCQGWGSSGGPLSLDLASPHQAALVFKSNTRELMIFKAL